MMKTICILLVWLCAVGLMSACEDKEVVTNGSVTGSITDSETQALLSGVTVILEAKSASVEMEKQEQLSSYSGNFGFGNLQSGRYMLTLKKEGYLPESGEILVLGKEVEVNGVMGRDSSYQPENPENPEEPEIPVDPVDPVDPTPVYPDVYVEVERYFTLSDGIYFYFKPSAGVSYYFWDFWKTNDVPSSEEKIINTLLLDGVRVEVNAGEEAGYGYNLQPNTRYKYYILAYNEDKVRGRRLISGEITTSSDVNQPVADISLQNSMNDTVYLKVTRNNNCFSYYMNGVVNISAAIKEKPDIWWAANYFYDLILKGNTEDISHTGDFSGKWWDWPLATDNIILTWGKDAKGGLSGVLAKKEFRLPLNTHTIIMPLSASLVKKPQRVQAEISVRARLKALAGVIVPFRNE